jgi:hypothetical protein
VSPLLILLRGRSTALCRVLAAGRRANNGFTSSSNAPSRNQRGSHWICHTTGTTGIPARHGRLVFAPAAATQDLSYRLGNVWHPEISPACSPISDAVFDGRRLLCCSGYLHLRLLRRTRLGIDHRSNYSKIQNTVIPCLRVSSMSRFPWRWNIHRAYSDGLVECAGRLDLGRRTTCSSRQHGCTLHFKIRFILCPLTRRKPFAQP